MKPTIVKARFESRRLIFLGDRHENLSDCGAEKLRDACTLVRVNRKYLIKLRITGLNTLVRSQGVSGDRVKQAADGGTRDNFQTTDKL